MWKIYFAPQLLTSLSSFSKAKLPQISNSKHWLIDPVLSSQLQELLPVLYSQSRYSCTVPPSELTGCICGSSCQPSCCRESVTLAGSSFSCLFLSNSWTLNNPADSKKVQIEALLHFWAKLLGRGGWKLKVTQPFPQSCTNLLNISQGKRNNFQVWYERSSWISRLISHLWALWHLSPERR